MNTPINEAVESEDLRMDAYYYNFEPTGVIEIDRVLSAVASAGKGCHHTEDWREYGFDTEIQEQANAAALAWKARAALPPPIVEPVRGTVGDLRATLAPFDDSMPINAAFFVEFQGKRQCRVKPLTVSRERVADGKWIRTGDESVPYSLIAWANQDERTTPASAPSDGAADARDGARWRAFRSRDEFDDLEASDFLDAFREDADAIIDAALASTHTTTGGENA